jgi:hypothetical protein
LSVELTSSVRYVDEKGMVASQIFMHANEEVMSRDRIPNPGCDDEGV